jgi:hypothetical protein
MNANVKRISLFFFQFSVKGGEEINRPGVEKKMRMALKGHSRWPVDEYIHENK